MKRTDMIKKLVYCLRETYCISSVDYEHVAEVVLATIEKQGMRPPCKADFGGHRQLDSNLNCNDYVESCDFHWEVEE